MGGRRARAAGNIPEPVTSFVGRVREMDGIRRRLSEARLVTLVGPGGVGKTRLALQVARDAQRAFSDGVWMADLASVSDPRRVAQAVAEALDVADQSARPAEDKLRAHLAERHLLLLLDNCEHLLDECARLAAELLAGSPNLRILATSREGLGIRGEHLYALDPLPAPRPDGPPTTSYDSVTLFEDRARAIRADFAVDDANRDAVLRLCAALDGMPLAIELAATRLRSLGVAELVRRLGDRFALLDGGSRDAAPRHQTLGALIDWSYDLCTAEEQLLWSRLSVFAGEFDLEAVEGVCADDRLPVRAVMGLLDHLVAKSIVQSSWRGDRAGFRLLATIREYGLTRASDEISVLRQRHRDHFAGRAAAMVDAWAGSDQIAALDAMRAAHPDLCAALDWSLDTPGQRESAVRMASDLRFHWVVGGFLSEGRRRCELILADRDQPSHADGDLLWVLAWIAQVQGDHEAGRLRAKQCAQAAEEAADEAMAAHATHWAALGDLFAGDAAAAADGMGRAIAGHRQAGNTTALLIATFQQVIALGYAGERECAHKVADGGIALSEGLGERWNRGYLWWARGVVAWLRGASVDAETDARTALGLAGGFHDGIAVALSIELLAWTAAADGEVSTAARRFGAAGTVWAGIGTTVDAFGPHLAGDSARARSICLDALGPAEFAKLTARSASMDAAVALALGGPDTAPATEQHGPLSKREWQVALLVAEGATNKAIAETLILSPRTIDGHVERILAKLGFSSRSQIAAWVTRAEGGA